MNYIYDVYLNFNNTLYDFYDWNKKDNIIRIKRIPIFRTSEKNIKEIISNKIVIDENLLKLIYNKTDIYFSGKKYTSCVFTDTDNLIAVMFDEKGNSIKKSYMCLEEEMDILDTAYKLESMIFNYKIINKEFPIMKTRKEYNELKFIKRELKNTNFDKLKYIYFECIGKESNDNNLVKDKLYEIIHNDECDDYKKLYNLLKLTSKSKIK